MNVAPLEEEVALSPEWLSWVLNRPITSVAVTERLETIATKVRFDTDNGSYCIKAYFNPTMRERLGTGQSEVHFYREVAPKLPIRIPTCLYNAIDPDTGHGLILMEDLKRAGCNFLTALSPYTVAQAQGTLDLLAHLHATHWNDAELDRHAFLAPRLATITNYVTVERLQSHLDDPRGTDLPAAVKSAEQLNRALLAVVGSGAGHDQTLVHGDAHAGNLYETPSGEPGLIDWQVMQRGCWALDVAYHVGAVLDTADRERAEQELLGHYLERLRAHGVTAPPSWEEAWHLYRTHLVYGYYMWAITRMVDRPIINVFTRRLGLAVAHHDSYALLEI